MNRVLSLLLAYIFLHTQAWALSGGPVYGSGGSNLSVIGTYAGVLLPEQVEGQEGGEADDTPGTGSGNGGGGGGGGAVVGGSGTGDNDSTSTSIGLFTLGVAEAGPATGAMVVFVEGTAFNGNITGVVDPANGALRAIIDATSTYSIITLIPSGVDANGNVTFDTVDTFVFAQGSLDAEIFSAGGFNPFQGSAAGSTRVVGTASIDIFATLEEDNTPDITSTARYTVEGFKQTDAVNQITFQFDQGFDGGGEGGDGGDEG